MATQIPQNRCVLSLGQTARATGGHLNGPEDLELAGISTDSRALSPGALFVALKGVRDGHEFLADAFQRGAAAALVEHGRYPGNQPRVEVSDTLSALGALARFHLTRLRARRPLTVIAIGGSAGKTTTKEFAAALAQKLFGSVLVTPGNLNNLIGVPATLLTLTEQHRAAVIECGTSLRGEIARLAAILQPDVAAVVNVDIEHSEGLGGLEDIADEESALFKGAGLAVVPAGESRLLSRIPPGTRVITFGESETADVRLAGRVAGEDGSSSIRVVLGPKLSLTGRPEELRAHLPQIGAAAALDAAAAVASVAAAAPRPLGREELAAMASALEAVRPPAGRMTPRSIAGIIVIDDTYNANPRSMFAALRAARETADARGTRLVVALGDMLELGELAAAAHNEVIREVARVRPNAFLAVGAEMAAACEASKLTAQGWSSVIIKAADSNEAARIVPQLASAGDVLLVKGSRGLRMERVIEALEQA
jgi:UDP-N-acetylmuramoyl-tripeptide--D-alanyl-D-alanine ligase